MSEPDEVVLTRRDGPIVTITINRPQSANAINGAVLEGLYRAGEEIRADESVRVVIVTGSGTHFCAGADLREDRASRRESRARFGGGIDFSRVPQPVVAAINGAALGGGCELALTCDFRFIADHTRIGLPEIKFGALPRGGGTARLPRIVGLSWAKRMIMTGEPVDANTAVHIGLADDAVPVGELLDRARSFAGLLLHRPDYALRAAKSVLDVALDVDLTEALRNEDRTARAMASGDQRRAARRQAAADLPTYAKIFAKKD